MILSERSELGPGTRKRERHAIRFQLPEHATRLEVCVALARESETRMHPSLIVLDNTH